MRALPDAVRAEVEASLEERTGRPTTLTGARPMPGGSINPAARIETDRGEAFFLKWNSSAPPEMFEAEADGLAALAGAAGEGLRVPEVIAVGARRRWLLLELVERGTEDGRWGGRLGRALAALHRPGGRVGWHRDNFIGSLPQANRAGGGAAAAADAWPRFWAEARIGPQLRAARDRGHFRGPSGRLLDEVLGRIPDLLEAAMPEGASLLHGDLWGGNVFPDARGRPVLVDPAVYRGHREVDLAMSELFGFPDGFLEAYRDARPVGPGYESWCRSSARCG